MINPSLTRGEYWLIEAVAEIMIQIRLLDRADLEIVLNKPGHEMDRGLLIETMQKLYSEGLITAKRIDDIDDGFVFTKEQLEAALNEIPNVKEHCYGLTQKGGQYWEAFASPNWNYYIDVGFQPIENYHYEFGELICLRKDHLKKYFKSLCFHEYDVDEKSIQWDILKPWKATYWKELPKGHRIRFRCKDKERNIDPHVPVPTDQVWYDKLWYHWR